jgi:hypothetical protein
VRLVKGLKIDQVFTHLRVGGIDEAEAKKRLREHGLNDEEIQELFIEHKKIDPDFQYSRRSLYTSQELKEIALKMKATRVKRKKLKDPKGGINVYVFAK